ncbi:tRNA-specific adenosine deaminase TAD2 [Cladobotryum mycophilum]|uniref:tRNA-specific adenosine deaminase TAD2 n=1 Tax=Cladobotryum mycophilum TaxID=491253 RepID=A0ABR0T3L3_9HYPO
MTGLKSLGLAGAKKAIRKLFRRGLPADEKVNDAPPATAKTTSTASSTTLAITSATLPSSNQDQTPQQQQQQQHQHESTTITDGMAPSAVMQQPLQDEYHDEDKENQPPPPTDNVDAVTKQLDGLKLHQHNGFSTQSEPESEQDQDQELDSEMMQDMAMFNDPVIMAERAKHLGFIDEALDMARLALKTNETPVGCVLVHDGQVIARGMNATNVTRNGTRHAEFMALSALLSYPPRDGPRTTSLKPRNLPRPERHTSDAASDTPSTESEQPSPDEGNEDGSKGHLYPYGQKCHPDSRVDREIIRESILYVTVEPCVMCASLLRQLGIKKVYFGAVNDKFGGTGGVFSIHANSLPIGTDGQTASAHPQPKPIQYPDGGGSLGTSFPPGGGDGGNVEPGYEIEGGWGRDEAVGLLRRFYVQENGRAPVPRKKEGRAARLAAMMEKDDNEVTPETTEEQEQEQSQGAATADLEFGDPDKENMDPHGGDDDLKSRSSGLVERGSLGQLDGILHETEDY